MYFARHDLPVPDKLILLSPWIDLQMDNPDIFDYMKNDPMLKYDELQVDARYWANGSKLTDYRLSPLYGDVSCLKDVTVFAGTHEFFYPDIVKFVKKLKEAKVKSRFIVGEGLNHVYPAYPIPEADEAIGIIAKTIGNKKTKQAGSDKA